MRRKNKERREQVADAVLLTLAAAGMVHTILSAPVPKVHEHIQTVPIGKALEAELAKPEYEQVGDWIIRSW